MTQLIIGEYPLPEVSGDRYSCPESPLVVQVEMINGRMVQEVRGGLVYEPTYEFDYMPASVWRPVYEILRSGQSFTAAVLTDKSDDLIVGTYLCTELSAPVFAFGRDGVGYWHNISFSLREVEPHAADL